MSDRTLHRYAVGDVVWVARAGTTQKERPCRICAGDRRVTLLLGSGDRVELDCDYCQAGWATPTGVELYYGYDASATSYVVTAIETVSDAQGEHVTYRSGSDGGWTSFAAADCYPTHDDAIAHCAEKVAQHEAEQEAQMARKEKGQRSYAWNAGYHLRNAEKARIEVLYHERKAVLMKAAARTPTEAVA